MKRFLQLVLCLLGLQALAAGLNNGSSWEDAWTNLSSVTWIRGDTYYIAGGTYTGDATMNPGAGASWTVLKKSNAADNGADANWDVSYASDQTVITGNFIAAGSYLQIDGVTGSSTNGHGIKLTNTENTGTVVSVYSTASFVKFEHVEIAGPGSGSSATGNDLLYWNPSAESKKGLLVHFCYIHGCTRNGITLGWVLGTSHTDYGVLIENTVISETGGCTDMSIHGQGIQMCFTSASMREHGWVTMRDSVIRNVEGSGYIAHIGVGFLHDFRYYNNLFINIDNTEYNYCSPGVINNNGSATCSNFFMANLTFYGIGGSNTNLAQVRFYSTKNTNISLTNCVWENCYFSTTNIGCDQGNNGFFNNTGAGVPSGTPGQVNGASTTFNDAPGIDFTLKSSGYAIGVGADLSAIFTTDFSGATRYAPWDIGAYKAENLIGWWKLDDGTGTTATDSAGSNDGALSGGPTWTTGRVGTYALTFDGEDSLVTIPYDAAWNFAGDFTVTAWVNSDTNSRLSAIGRWNANLWNGWTLEQVTQVRFDFEYQDRTVSGEGAHRSVGSGLGYLTNEWHFVCGVLSNDIVRVYVDGNVGTMSNPITNSIALTTEGIAFGARKVSTPDAYWRGAVDDVRIYNRMLTGAEILALYNGTGDVTAPTPNPLTWSSVPVAVDSDSITMVASTATDETSTVSYYFDETSGNPGGSDSGWQASATYTDSGLTAATLYTYRVKARDEATNETGYSSSENATTDAEPAGTTILRATNVRAGTIRRP